MCATQMDHADVVELLMKKRACVFAKDKQGRTVVEIAKSDSVVRRKILLHIKRIGDMEKTVSERDAAADQKLAFDKVLLEAGHEAMDEAVDTMMREARQNPQFMSQMSLHSVDTVAENHIEVSSSDDTIPPVDMKASMHVIVAMKILKKYEARYQEILKEIEETKTNIAEESKKNEEISSQFNELIGDVSDVWQ